MTEILKMTPSAVKKAAEVLAEGGVVVYPTETVYGIGVDATNDKAVEKIIKIKKRADGKRILVAFCDLRMARNYVVIGKDTEILANQFMPGPLSIVVPSRSSEKDVGFRIPDNKVIQSIIRKLGKPITSTSANTSGGQDSYDIKVVKKLFDGKVDLILDSGRLKKTKPSTVYRIADRKILRKGPVSEKQITTALGL